jgi:class 3 adenylate cyclase
VDASLDDRLATLAAAGGFAPDVIARFGAFLTGAREEELFRTNPLRFAASTGIAEHVAVELFVRAVSVGVLEFAWGVVCRRCGLFIGTRSGMLALSEHTRCTLCRISIVPSPDDNVEVTFTVSPAVRRLRLHAPLEEQDLVGVLLHTYSTRLALASGFLEAMDAYLPLMVARLEIQGGESCDLEFEMDGEGSFAVGAPTHHAGAHILASPDGPAEATLELLEGAIVPPSITLAPGRARVTVRNRTRRAAGAGVRRLPPGMILPESRGELGPVATVKGQLPVFSGRRLVASQSFRDLFKAESLPADTGLELRSLTFLFTDLKGSTALYDRVGDLRAYELVRTHFKLLRRAIHAHGGAVVKTMGDAVMATFAEPIDGMRAAVAMHEELRGGSSELLLKVGLHVGHCIAVENNEQLDYFGQTVNIAARVQGLAEAREIVCTEAVHASPGVAGCVAQTVASGVEITREHAALKGVEGETAVVRLRNC